MKTLFAVVYDSEAEARKALARLTEEQKGATISLLDAVVVTRSEDGSVKLHQSVNTTAVGAASGALWGSLIGLIFLSPLLGAAAGTVAGGLGGYFSDYGISDDFMKSLGQKVPGNRAALFILAGAMTADKVADAIGSPTGEVLYTSMPDDIEKRFKSHFAHRPAEVEPQVTAAATSIGG